MSLCRRNVTARQATGADIPPLPGKGTTRDASEIRLVQASATCSPMGASNGRCRFEDEEVARARKLRARGMLLREIARALGCGVSTVHWWTAGRGRAAPVRVIVKVGPPRRRR